mgnify:CR=1 FL=1
MFEIILQFVIILSIAGILIIVGRKIPEVTALSVEEKESKTLKNKDKIYQKTTENTGRIHKFFKKIKDKIKSVGLEKFVERGTIELEKILRKIRIQFLKLDQKLFFLIKKLREKSDRALKSQGRQEWLDAFKSSKKTVQFISKAKKSISAKRKNVKSAVKKTIVGRTLRIVDKEKKYIKAIAKNPKDIGSYRRLGLIYLEQKNYTDAKASFEQILKIDPKDREAKKELKKIEKLMSV